MKKRNLIITFLTGIMVLIAGGCSSTQTVSDIGRESQSSSSKELKKLRVAVQNYFLSSSVGYMVENNIDEKFGLDITLVEYSTGAEQIKDIENDQYDIVTIGAAYLEPLSQNQAVLIGEFIELKGGNGIYVRKDNPALKIKGFNPTYPQVYGNLDTLNNCSILLKKDTTQQYLGMKWLESVGVKSDKVNFVYENGDFEQLYDRFLNDEGDVVVLSAPSSYKAERQGFEKVADIESLHMKIYEVLLATRTAYEDKKEELVSFIECLLYTHEILEEDMNKKIDAGVSWYEAHGQKIDAKIIRFECEDKIFITKDNYDLEQFGESENKYAEYMATLGNISPLVLDNIENNIDSKLFETAMERAKTR